MSLQDEQGLGREMAAKIVGYYHLYSNEELLRYVNLVGATVAAQSKRSDIKYQFAILDTDAIDTFSAPGGYVFVTRGVLALCDDESELAGVLAHEVAVVDGKYVIRGVERGVMLQVGAAEAAKHAPDSYQQRLIQSEMTAMLRDQPGIFVVEQNPPGSSAVSEKKTQPPADNAQDSGQPEGEFGPLATSILRKMLDQGLAPYDEYDADARGATYAHDAGYPADGLERLLTKIDQFGNRIPTSLMLHSHPPTKNRIERLRQLVSIKKWEDSDRPRLAERLIHARAGLPTLTSPKP